MTRLSILNAILLSAALSLVSCGGSTPASTLPSTTPPSPTPPSTSLPRTVSGQVLDTQGKPLSGALIWVRPALTTGLVTLRSDPQGRYVSPPLVNVPYRTYAAIQTEYRGQTFCQRLAAGSLNEYDAFSPDSTGTVTRNFRWRISGAMPDGENSYFGGDVRVFHRTWRDDQEIVADDSTVELRLAPDGPLIDGSAGKTLVKAARVGENMLYDIPVGHYAVTATEVHKDGTRTGLVVGDYAGPPAATTTLGFKPTSGSCIGGTSNGVDRAFVYVARP